MRSFKKMTAVVMAVATLATSMVPFSADALYYNENSKFLPGVYSLGQILGENGYKNIFITLSSQKSL